MSADVSAKKLLKRTQEIFFQKLMSKTGWGRNEIMAIFRESTNEAMMEMLD